MIGMPESERGSGVRQRVPGSSSRAQAGLRKTLLASPPFSRALLPSRSFSFKPALLPRLLSTLFYGSLRGAESGSTRKASTPRVAVQHVPMVSAS